MGKLLSLGPKLQYPVTITKFHKQNGAKIQRQEKILEFTWVSQTEVGDFMAQNTWMEDRVTFGDWDSPIDGEILSWKIKVGQVIEKDMKFVEVEEDCPHSIQFAGLCGMCGKDMTEIGFASATADTTRAQINMIHDQMSLKVSKDEATRVEDETQRRLLKQRKLSLVVDLDCTVIHAAVDPTIWEWMHDPNSPNYDVCQDIARFQLEEGPRNMPQGMWYYVKQRPGLEEFLDKVAELYELHIYTMGTRAYARNIAKVVDPTKRLFGDRIISRDENGSMTEKNLARLFPDNTKMVAIIDDRSDVWPANRSNLIKVVPFNFFLGVGDINASFLPKLQEAPRTKPKKKTPEPDSETKVDSEQTEASTLDMGEADAPAEVVSERPEVIEDPIIPEVVTTATPPKPPTRLNEEAVREEQLAEQGKALEEQLIERPLLHLQEQLDQEEERVDLDEAQNGQPRQQRRHPLLSGDDNELHYLQKHLALLHKTFYEEYDSAVRNVSGGRVAQLKPGAKKLPIKDAKAVIVPDVADILPRLKAPLLDGCTIVLSGLVPLMIDVLKSELGIQVKSFGADLRKRISKRVTHLVTESSRSRTSKVKEAAQLGTVKIVNQDWLIESMSRWERVSEDPYLVEIHEGDRKRPNGTEIPVLDDDSFEESPSGSDSDDDKENSNAVSGSQDDDGLTTDDEGIAPPDLEPGQSPIDEFASMDWGDMGDEINDLSGSDDDSDASSVTSETSRRSENGIKRRRGDITDEDDSDDGSQLSKKQKTSSDRSKAPSRLKESSLPTPGVTGEENNADDAVGDSGSDDNDLLEAELLAEFEKGDDDEDEDEDAA